VTNRCSGLKLLAFHQEVEFITIWLKRRLRTDREWLRLAQSCSIASRLVI
jgi:hypothetical protein